MSKYFDSLNRRAQQVPVAPLRQPVEVPVGQPVEAPPIPARQQRPRLLPVAAPGKYSALRESLLAAANGKPLNTLVFAGCSGGEGCTQVVREFAETLAGSGLKVLLVDADARTSGLTASTAASGTDLTELVVADTQPPPISWGKGELTLVPSPASVPDKERFFVAPGFAAWLEKQRRNYDYVLLDAPPLLKFADGTLMGRLADGIVIVVQAEATERESLVRAREHLQRANVNILGVVLNRVRDPVPAALRPYLSTE